MANLPAQQAQYVKYAEKDKHGIEIAGLGDVVEMNSARTEMTIGTKLVVDGDISTEDDIACKDITASGDVSVGDDLTVTGDLNVTGTADIGTLEFTSANVAGNLAVGANLSAVGNIGPMENIVDADGHKRFQEWNGQLATIEGLTITYAKASLSGSHLMVVLAGNLATGATIALNTRLVFYELPQWINSKIYAVWGGYQIESKTIKFIADDWSNTSALFTMEKVGGGLKLFINQNLTADKDYGFRMQFDLLID